MFYRPLQSSLIKGLHVHQILGSLEGSIFTGQLYRCNNDKSLESTSKHDECGCD